MYMHNREVNGSSYKVQYILQYACIFQLELYACMVPTCTCIIQTTVYDFVIFVRSAIAFGSVHVTVRKLHGCC